MTVGLVGRSAGVSRGIGRNTSARTAPWRVTTGADGVFLAHTVKRCSDIARCIRVGMTSRDVRTMTAVRPDDAQLAIALVDLLSSSLSSASSSEDPAIPKASWTRRSRRAENSEIMTTGIDSKVLTTPATDSFSCRGPRPLSTPVWRAACRKLGDQLGAAS